ncbi:heme exporter protein CcmD [Paracandidimonas soli]|uniref:Heme exporter protein D n=1 Tax=Paracandidimonas soli TaxID=1917182 RepID=A0A4V2VPS9_9BURK|nr:heme exporter protein CcmD [Paracandidimonas soli]TCU91929.1 heme exporter protein D [Paracandidimonas soli]
MQWQSWSDFWHMGGNAWFVWGSYGLTLALLLLELLQLRRAGRSARQRLLRWHRETSEEASRATERRTGSLRSHGNLS